MYQVEDEPIETIHVYVVREGQRRPSIVAVIISFLTLSLLIAVGVLTPYRQPEQRAAIRVPAILLPVRTFTTSVEVMPTGSKTYPATRAYGVLTIYNGSILSQELPQGMIVTENDGVEVSTSEAVTVPAGNPPSYGIARVLRHAIVSGSKGNIAAFDINQVYGTSLYIRNLQHFTGGKDAYSVMFATAQDRATALTKAHVTLMQQIFTRLLYKPCVELVTGTKILQVTWTCQFFTYNVPSLPHVRVLHVQVVGKTVFLAITYTQRPKRLETK